jgi:hypothetical protein
VQVAEMEAVAAVAAAADFAEAEVKEKEKEKLLRRHCGLGRTLEREGPDNA